MDDWVVVLEFSAPVGDRPFELNGVQAVVERLREWHPSGLYNPNRYAIQLHVPANGADEALRLAGYFHGQVAHAAGVTAMFTRAEVVTLGELEESWHDAVESVASGPPAALISVEVYEATRALLGASTPAEVADVLVRFVLAVGGRVEIGRPVDIAGTVSVDLALAPGVQLYAMADSFSVAGLIIERWLPPLIDDAKQTLVLLEGPP